VALEAADAGDTVLIAAGTYGSSVQLNDRLGVLYNCVNNGTVGNPITFTANGDVRIAAHALNAGVIGSVAGEYIKWYADRVTGTFLITCDGRFTSSPVSITGSSASSGVLTITAPNHGLTNGQVVLIRNHASTPAFPTGVGNDTPVTATLVNANTFSVADRTYTAGGGATGDIRPFYDTKADTTVVNTTPDTAPIVLVGSENCWFEGFDIDGGSQTDYADNWSAFRLEGTLNTTIRNCLIENFHNMSLSTNGSGIKHYSSQGTLVEFCTINNTGSGFSIKDNDALTYENGSYLFRRCLITDVVSAFSWSQTDEPGAGDITECLCTGDGTGDALFMTGGDMNNERVFNCTFVGFRDAIYISTPQSWNGVKIWNNIFASSSSRSIEYEGQTCPAATLCSYQHNVYQQTGSFYAGSDGARTFSSFNAAYPSQHALSPVAVSADPLFVGGGSYLLQASSPAKNLGRHPDTSAVVDAGCYPSGVETTIGLEN
jgi:hypothetical protein